MSLRFVLGRAGTGKTRHCLESIRSELVRSPEGPPLVLLVPEQATFQTDRALLEGVGIEGSIRAQVYSFQRLARRVLRATGAPDLPEIRETGRRMILRRILLDLEAEGALRAFGHAASRPRFVERLAGALSELRRHGQGPAEIAARRAEAESKGAPPLLVSKLADLERIARLFEGAIRGRGLDGDAFLDLAARALRLSKMFDGLRAWVDGFAGFTPQEISLLSAILGKAASVEVTLCLDPLAAEGTGDGVFARSRETMDRLSEIARRMIVPVAQPLRLVPAAAAPRFRAPALAAVEAALAGAPAPPRAEGGGVSILVARDLRGEAEAAAREALRLRRAGLRWRDIAVLARSLEPYADLLAGAFRERRIPLFLDRRRPASHHPLVELVRSAVEACVAPATLRPLQSSAVIRAAKTGLLALEEVGHQSEADLLENYVLAHGIEGAEWTDGAPWRAFRRRRLEDDEPSAAEKDRREAAERARRKLAPLLALAAALRPGVDGRVPVAPACDALALFLDASGARARLRDEASRARAAGDREAAESHRLVHNQVLETIHELAGALGKERMEPIRLLSILESGLEAIRLSLVPPTLDAVVAAEVERSRTPEVRAAIVLGLSEGSFPSAHAEDPMITDDERAALGGLGAALRLETSRERLFHEPFLAYVALTRARERLLLLRPETDGEGRTVREAGVVSALARAIPSLRPEIAPDPGDADPRSALAGSADARDLVRLAARGGAAALPLAGFLRKAPIDPVLTRALDPARLRPAADRLPRGILQSLYRPPISFGVSALETFAACPFQHFAKSILRLEERPRFLLETPEIGVFLHAVLERTSKAFGKGSPRLADASDEDLARVLAEAVEGIVPRLQSGALARTARARALLGRLTAILLMDLKVLREHARRGAFENWGSEVSFGESKSGLPAIRIPVDEGTILVRGRMDRIETAPSPTGGTLVRVVDFKSTARRIDWGFLLEGIQIQLFAYLLLARQEGPRLWVPPIRIVGALYWPLLPEPIGEAPRPDLETAYRKAARPKGLLPAEPRYLAAFDRETGEIDLFSRVRNNDGEIRKGAEVLDTAERARLLDFVEDKLRTLARGVLSGETVPAPWRRSHRDRACNRCDHLPFCRFDLLSGDRYRELPPSGFEALKARLAEDLPKGAEP